MPWRLIGIIAVIAYFLFFIGFNLGHTIPLNLVFFELPDVEVSIIILGSFLLGMLTSLILFMIYIRKKHQKEKPPTVKKNDKKTSDAPAPESQDIPDADK